MEILGFQVDMPAALENQYMEFLVNLLVWVVIGGIAVFVADMVIHRLVKRTKTEWDDIIFQMIRLPMILLVFLYGFVSSFSRLDIPGGVENGVNLLYRVVLAVVLLYVGWSIYKRVFLEIFSQEAKKKGLNIEKTLIPVLSTLGKMAVIFIGFMVFLGFLGVNVGLLMTSFGILGLVIALAAQDTLSNMFSGIHMLIDRPFQIGDIIMLEDGDYYEVRWVGMRSTRLYNTFKHTLSTVPNSIIASQRIVNISSPNPRIKTNVGVGVSYDTELDKAKAIMLDVARNTEHVMVDGEHDPWVRTVSFDESSITLKVYCWIDHYDHQWAVMSEIRENVLKRFREEGIEIPFPQRVVYIREEKAQEGKSG
ncbi:MAG: mechanosensitive ion channel family protein [Thermoplasmata archaeon]|nr:mechanosensitive ion channel family protein [Thermoplasmata archaeon]